MTIICTESTSRNAHTLVMQDTIIQTPIAISKIYINYRAVSSRIRIQESRMVSVMAMAALTVHLLMLVSLIYIFLVLFTHIFHFTLFSFSF